jgi:hypothetical protein
MPPSLAVALTQDYPHGLSDFARGVHPGAAHASGFVVERS